MTELDDMTKRILNKIDHIESLIDDLCGRMMKVELQLDNHFRNIKKKESNKDKKFYVIMCVMGILFTMVQVAQSWF